jgi:predicted esterase
MRVVLALAASAAACGGGSRVAPPDGRQADARPDALVFQHDAPPLPIDADLTAATDVPAVPCTDTIAAVYAATPGTGPLGTILACAPDPVVAMADAQTAVGAGVVATSAVAQFRIAYQTRDGAGQPAVSTARAYLPSTPRARPVPIVVAGHGSVGIADSCASSLTIDDSLSLPYAARGFAAIAPDLAGLGNAGTQDYLDNHAQGWQLLDGARALRALMAPGITAPELLLTGYSQGGGAALSAQALYHADGEGIGTLKATVVYAPEWPIRLNSFNYLGMLRDPTQLTIFTGLSFSSVAVLRQYAWFADHTAAGIGNAFAPAALRDGVESAAQSQCLVAFGGYVQTQMLHTGDLIDDTLRTDFLACVDGNGTGAACTGDANASGYYQFLVANHLHADPTAGPVLIVQGGLDQIMPPAGEAACVRDKLASEGVDVSTCVFPVADHSNIMDNHASGVAWAESVLGGGARAECDQSNTLPTCAP